MERPQNKQWIKFVLPIQTEESLEKFLWYAWRVRIPKVSVCGEHVSPWRAFCDAFFARSSIQVWHASRGFGGKSFLLAVLGLTEAILHKANVAILGGSGEQSKRVHRYIQHFLDLPTAPKYLLRSDPSQTETKFLGGNSIQALMASQRSVRGPHPQRLRMDEIDEMDLEVLDAALGQTLASRNIAANTVLSSTWQNPSGTMSEIMHRARERGWPVYQWCYKETSNPVDGWLSQSEIERKKHEIPDLMWEIEYELQEPAPQNRVFSDEVLQRAFLLREEYYEGALNQFIQIEPPDPNGLYVTGADWARKQDYTVIVTIRIDCDPFKLVTFERRNQQPWRLMLERLDYVNQLYQPIASTHDGTGLGDVVNEYLTTAVQPFVMVGRDRQELLSRAIVWIQNGKVVFPYIKWLYDELKYCTMDNVFGSGHLSDALAAIALALHQVKTGVGIYV
jgi:hypothetical protein